METSTVKILLSLAALVGSMGLLAIDWASRTFVYL